MLRPCVRIFSHSEFRIPHSGASDRCASRRVPLGQAGIALFLVLWVLTLLSVIVGEFCHAMRGEVNTVRNFKEETEAYYIAQAGVFRAIEELVRKHVFPKPPEEKTIKAEEEIPVDVWRVNVDIPAVKFGQGSFEVRLDNESGKVDLNAANPAMLRMLLNHFELEEQEKDVIVDSILDWRDEDDLHRLNGAEDDYYLGLPKPYPCKDGDFDAVEELLLVRGVTAEVFLGGLKELVTVFPYEESGRRGFRPGQKEEAERCRQGQPQCGVAPAAGALTQGDRRGHPAARGIPDDKGHPIPSRASGNRRSRGLRGDCPLRGFHFQPVLPNSFPGPGCGPFDPAWGAGSRDDRRPAEPGLSNPSVG